MKMYLMTRLGCREGGGGRYVPNYFLTDHLGSTRVVVDANGATQQRSDYYAFGERWANAGSQYSDNRYLFSGKEDQSSVGVVYSDFGARMLDKKTGRWSSIDPLAKKYYPWSPYNYALNNPIKFIDPDGKKVILVVKHNNESPSVKYSYSPQTGVVNLQTGESASFMIGTKEHAIVSTYNEVYGTGQIFKDQIDGLVQSESEHFILIGVPQDISGSGVRPGSPGTKISEALTNVTEGISISTTTNYDFSDKEKSRIKAGTGIEHTNGSIVSHELRHQSDFDRGKMKDSVDKKGENDPSESRAIENENIYRKENELEERRGYYGNF